MKDWIEKLNGFLILNDRDILNHAGKMSHPLALEHAESEYEKFHVLQLRNFKSDFDNAVNNISKLKAKSEQKKITKGGNNKPFLALTQIANSTFIISDQLRLKIESIFK